MEQGANIIQFARQHLGSHYLWGAAGSVVQAQDHVTGVHVDERYNASTWTSVRRFPESIDQARKHVSL